MKKEEDVYGERRRREKVRVYWRMERRIWECVSARARGLYFRLLILFFGNTTIYAFIYMIFNIYT